MDSIFFLVGGVPLKPSSCLGAGGLLTLLLTYPSTLTNLLLHWLLPFSRLLTLHWLLLYLSTFMYVYRKTRLLFSSDVLLTLGPRPNTVQLPNHLQLLSLYLATYLLLLLIFLSLKPSYYKKALKSPKKANKLLATDKEFSSLSSKCTWHLVPLVSPMRVIGCSWKY